MSANRNQSGLLIVAVLPLFAAGCATPLAWEPRVERLPATAAPRTTASASVPSVPPAPAPAAAPRQVPVTFDEIVQMARDGTPSGVIIQKLRDSRLNYSLSAEQAKDLAARGVPPDVIAYLERGEAGKFDAHVLQRARVVRRDVAAQCPPGNPCNPATTIRPASILNYARVQGTPLALAAVLALLAVATIAHLLFTSIRRRRRDLAVLKTLGFVRGQVSATVAWQATAVVAISLAVGIPVGVVAGRSVWTAFADRLGVPGDPRVPLVTLLVAVPVALVVANALAAGPGWVAGRLKPAPVLRTE
jgi:hypothetical protein